jgi:hypothetical protein
MPWPVPPLALVLLALVAGCGSPKVTLQPGAPRARDYSPADRIRVMLSAPGPANEAASRIVSARVIEVLQQTHADVVLVPTADQAEALAAARSAKAACVISPTILEWVDSHAPPLTADRVKVRLDLLDPHAGEVLSTLTFENVTPLVSVGDTRPEALLDRSFDSAVTLLVTTGSPGQGTVREPGPGALEHVPVDEQKYPRQ